MPGRLERNKDVAQEVIESGAQHVGRIAQILTTAVVDVTREVGSLATDVFEMREAATRARLDADEAREIDALPDDDAVPAADEVEVEVFDDEPSAD
ncbi:MAG: hypothetical protein M0P31_10260 [Solirubrobacteraceae bacterium]|nr:hypothetical protein [Solirubrobacteraceae bacterium]